MTTETAVGIPTKWKDVPTELTERPQWVCWGYEERDGKRTKVPYNARTGERASTTDLLTWSTIEEAFAGMRASEGRLEGVGFVFSSGDPYTGIDLDNCVPPDHTGYGAQMEDIAPWALKIIDRVQEGYIEVSPGGTGVHIIVEGTVRSSRSRRDVVIDGKVVGRIEMYDRGRFFTVTGRVLR